MVEQRVALVTAARLGEGMEDTVELIEQLRRAGAEADLPVWNAPEVAWDGYTSVHLHSPWDYSEHLDGFLGWLGSEQVGGRTSNDASLIAWNTDKRYLLELQERGVALPRTVLGLTGSALSAQRLRDELGECRIVVKPTISAGGRRAWLCDSPELAYQTIQRQAPAEAVLAQVYEADIETLGEFSAVYLGGELSHVVRKTPAAGDFRVQGHFGGRTEPVAATDWIARYCAAVLAAAPSAPAYARVDFLVDRAGDPKLMELELVEPDLFLRYCPRSYQRLTQLLLHRT
ncbi:hypothetical protein GCM10023322_06300 [Rugosimonospora acidiphila]|uniref:ATP-grasp domain-containing protein n=1 Tax=Rugosimonospora acidiphila TaxID=556531 RepID=A0ABP9RJW1_9ACTN